MTALDTMPASDMDISAIADEEWLSRRLPVKVRSSRAPVIIARSVLNDIHDHGKGSSDVEVCGILVGNVYRDEDKPFVHIEAAIRGNHATSKSAQVTFTADTWTSIQQILETSHPDKRILGWYHTHPGYGIFLSDMDVFIHKNFFSLPWHTAFVYDPQANEEGLFVWRNGALAPEKFIIQEDVEQDATPALMQTNSETTSTAAPPGTVLELTARVQDLEKRQRWLLAGMALFTMIAIAWPLLVNIIIPALKPTEAPATDPPTVQSLRQAEPTAARNSIDDPLHKEITPAN
jgi:proteasome lid subunit RPN8/RPN11